jgi:hypothetical protein
MVIEDPIYGFLSILAIKALLLVVATSVLFNLRYLLNIRIQFHALDVGLLLVPQFLTTLTRNHSYYAFPRFKLCI